MRACVCACMCVCVGVSVGGRGAGADWAQRVGAVWAQRVGQWYGERGSAAVEDARVQRVAQTPPVWGVWWRARGALFVYCRLELAVCEVRCGQLASWGMCWCGAQGERASGCALAQTIVA